MPYDLLGLSLLLRSCRSADCSLTASWVTANLRVGFREECGYCNCLLLAPASMYTINVNCFALLIRSRSSASEIRDSYYHHDLFLGGYYSLGAYAVISCWAKSWRSAQYLVSVLSQTVDFSLAEERMWTLNDAYSMRNDQVLSLQTSSICKYCHTLAHPLDHYGSICYWWSYSQ